MKVQGAQAFATTSANPAAAGRRIAELRSLALSRYAGCCFWNMRVPAGAEGDKVIVERLKKHGDMEAWRLAVEIEALADAA